MSCQISRSGSFAVDLVGILFGDVLGTTTSDIVIQGVAAMVIIAGVIAFYRPLLVLAFNKQKAEVLGLNPGLTHLGMMGLITLAVVTSFQTVGTLLVFGLLVAPPATANLVARRVPLMMATSALAGGFSVVGGLVVSYHYDTSAGATMSGMAVVLFFLTLAAKGLTTRLRPITAREIDETAELSKIE